MEAISYCFIVNPVAGRNRAEKLLPLISKEMTARGIAFDIKLTEGKGDGKILAEKAIEEGYKVIVAVGGDGTINEVINGAYGKEGIVGIIPAGTGNDFARSLNISFDFYRAIEDIIKGTVGEVDVGLINQELFINVASIGLDAHIAAEANKIKRYFNGSKAYIMALLKGIITYQSMRVRLVTDDMVLDKHVMLVAFCNGGFYGGGMNIAPAADATDGLMDICIVERMSKLKLLRLFPTIFKGSHIKFEEVKQYRAKAFEIFVDNDIFINTDGEIINYSPLGNHGEGISTRIAAKRLKIIK